MPVPKPGFEDKVFYVWFDAPIGYIAAAVEWSRRTRLARLVARPTTCVTCSSSPRTTCPFHAISFPATLLGSGLPFKLVDVIKGFNWLTFEGGKFSTSGRRGIFTDAALDAVSGRLLALVARRQRTGRQRYATSPSSASSTA